MEDFEKLYKEVGEWAATLVPNNRAMVSLHHMKKEILEAIEALEDYQKDCTKVDDINMEYADLAILLFNSASDYGLNPERFLELIREKLEINKKRIWGTPDKNGVVEHIKGIHD